MVSNITSKIKYIGVDDLDIDLFESQYDVPNGMSYNSYLILDEKVAIMDTCDQRKAEEWKKNLAEGLEGRTPDYLVVHHMEWNENVFLSRVDNIHVWTVVLNIASKSKGNLEIDVLLKGIFAFCTRVFSAMTSINH